MTLFYARCDCETGIGQKLMKVTLDKQMAQVACMEVAYRDLLASVELKQDVTMFATVVELLDALQQQRAPVVDFEGSGHDGSGCRRLPWRSRTGVDVVVVARRGVGPGPPRNGARETSERQRRGGARETRSLACCDFEKTLGPNNRVNQEELCERQERWRARCATPKRPL